MSLHFDDEVTTARESVQRDLAEGPNWSDLIGHSKNLLCVHDLEGRLLSVNDAASRLLGYSEDEMLQRPMRDFLNPADRPLFDAYLEEIKDKGESHGLMTVVTRSGENLVWEYHNTLHGRGSPVQFVSGIALDVTKRVRAEQQLLDTNEKLLRITAEQEGALQRLTLFRALLDHANDAIMVIDSATLRFLDLNEKASAMLGYTRDELLSLTVFEIDPEVTDEYRCEVMRRLKDEGSVMLERRHKRKDGSTFPVEVNLRRVHLDREYTVAVARDITSRKLAEDRLREFERVVENLEEMIVVVDRDYRYVIVNRSYLTYRQCTAESLIGLRVSEILGRELFENTVKGRLDECFSGKVVTFETECEFPQIGRRDLSITYVPVIGAKGTNRVACVMHDITEEKMAEQALQSSEARERARANELQTVLDAVPIPVYISHDRECRTITGNRAAYGQLRVPEGANFSKSAPLDELPNFRLLQEGVEVAPDMLPMQMAALKGECIYERAQTMLFEDGTERQTLVNAVPLFDDLGNPRGAVGASIDLTDLKNAEKALRESEQRFRALYERSPIGITLIDSRTGQFLQVNQKFCEIAGRTEKDLLARDVMSITHTEDCAKGTELLQQLVEEKLTRFEVEKRYVRPDQSIRWVRILVVPMWKQGDVRRWHMALVQDITERRQAEDSLRQSEERFRVALKHSPISVFNQDRDLRYTWMYNSQLGLPGSESGEASPEELFEPEDATQIAKARRRVMETGTGERSEIRIQYNGKTHYFDTTVEPMVNAAGEITGITGASTDITELRETSDALREAKKRLTEEKLYLEKEIDTALGFGEIIGQSKALQDVMKQVAKVASTSATVLLLGETGTGKELVARAIHRLSQRPSSSFIRMNCAAIPSGLLESELFGHEKGAFTGAISKKLGRLELADEGTLFLDEIGEIALELQPKLLRVLQDQEFERLGGNQTIKVNFRLIAATNSNLADRVRENEFRSDLFYRLNVFPIYVPPLRERREDIRPLVKYFVDKFARRMNKLITSIPRKTMDALTSWNWPGNVRELENFIERSVILTEGSVLVVPLNALESHVSKETPADQTLESAERQYILRALRESQGMIGGPRGAAMRLGLKRTTLQSKMKHLGINPDFASFHH
jgi:PAS domain S-box-containing protein